MRFYKATNAAMVIPMPPQADDSASPTYGTKSKVVYRVIDKHREDLKAMPTRRKRAEWISAQVRCSPSTARDCLKNKDL
jgi:hypothetical protein